MSPGQVVKVLLSQTSINYYHYQGSHYFSEIIFQDVNKTFSDDIDQY